MIAVEQAVILGENTVHPGVYLREGVLALRVADQGDNRIESIVKRRGVAVQLSLLRLSGRNGEKRKAQEDRQQAGRQFFAHVVLRYQR